MSSGMEMQRPSSRKEALARTTPYELVFTSGEFESLVFPRIREEAREQRVDVLSPERFDFLATAADVVRDLTPEDAPPDALAQYRALVFQAYHFWLNGRRLYVLDPAAARYLVEAPPSMQEWSFDIPAPAAYLQLPANLFWSSTSPSSTPEPVDGFFLTRGSAVDPLGKPFAYLAVLMVLGIHRSRAGFAVIPLDTVIGPGVIASWAAEGQRSGGDFANVLPGGELSGLYSILTAGEVFQLVGRAFWYAQHFPDALVRVPAPEPRPGEDAPPPTRLAYTRIALDPATSPAAPPDPEWKSPQSGGSSPPQGGKAGT